MEKKVFFRRSTKKNSYVYVFGDEGHTFYWLYYKNGNLHAARKRSNADNDELMSERLINENEIPAELMEYATEQLKSPSPLK